MAVENWTDVLLGEFADGRELPRVDPSWFVRPNGNDASRTIHGVRHTLRVWVHAIALADILGLEPWQREALELAVKWHDIGRTNDWADYYHGAKSAGRVIGLGLHLEPEVGPAILETALFAVTHHCGNEDHARRAAKEQWLADFEQNWDVLRLLKDADALDRVRLGRYDLDPSQLRFDESHARIDRAWEMYRASGD